MTILTKAQAKNFSMKKESLISGSVTKKCIHIYKMFLFEPQMTDIRQFLIKEHLKGGFALTIKSLLILFVPPVYREVLDRSLAKFKAS